MELSLPSLPESLLLGVGIGLLYIVASSIISWYRLRHFKGPFIASFSYLFILRKSLSGRQAEVYGDVVEKYGKIARIGPSVLITGDGNLVRRMNAARTRYERSDYYKALRMDPYHDSLFSIVDGKAHDLLKAQMSHGYGGKDVPTLEDDIDEQINIFIDVLRHKYARANGFRPADLATLCQYFTIDILSKIAYGKEFGNIPTESDVYGYTDSPADLLKLLVLCAEIPYCRSIFMNKTVLRLFGPSLNDKRGMGRILCLARDLVAKRFRPDAEDELDMLGSFKRHGCTQTQCEGEIPFQIVAGSDTTAHAIRGTLLYLMTSPQAYRKLQDEVDTAIHEGIVSQPIKAKEAQQMQYLQGVIYEGLRLTMPATLLSWKQAPPEEFGFIGDTVDGVFIPGGTRIAVAVRPIMRDRSVFGDDADLFRPERWLGIDPEKRRNMVDTAELIFGYGRFGCSGKSVALLELNKIFFELLRNFDFQLVNPRVPVESTFNIQAHYDRGMWVNIVDRKAEKVASQRD